MAQETKNVEVALLILLVAIFSAVVLPALFGNLVSLQTNANSDIMRSVRIIIMVLVFIILIGGSYKIIGGWE